MPSAVIPHPIVAYPNKKARNKKKQAQIGKKKEKKRESNEAKSQAICISNKVSGEFGKFANINQTAMPANKTSQTARAEIKEKKGKKKKRKKNQAAAKHTHAQKLPRKSWLQGPLEKEKKRGNAKTKWRLHHHGPANQPARAVHGACTAARGVEIQIPPVVSGPRIHAKRPILYPAGYFPAFAASP